MAPNTGSGTFDPKAQGGQAQTFVAALLTEQEVLFAGFAEQEPVNFGKIKTDEALPGRFKQASALRLFIDNRFFTLIPDALKEESRQMAADIFGKSDLHLIHEPFDGFTLLYGEESHRMDAYRQRFTGRSFESWAALSLRYWMQQSRGGDELFIDLRNGYFNAAVFQDKQLKLFNSFAYSGINDFGFFAVGLAKNHGFKAGNMKYYLTGNISQGAPAYNLLLRYLGEPTAFNTGLKEEFKAFEILINTLKK